MDKLNHLAGRLQDGIHSKMALFGLSDGMSDWMTAIIMLSSILLLAVVSFYITHCYFKLLLRKERSCWVQDAAKQRVFYRFSYLVPGFILYACLPILADLTLPFIDIVISSATPVLAIYMIVMSAFVISAGLNTAEACYRRTVYAIQFPIKSYIQVLKILLFIFTSILVISILINKSPAYFLTGIGAMMAVILLIFKDSILGLVASVQLTTNDMVRLGDWIEVPNFGADGDVIDVSLNTIKVQNFDKTIVTIPSYALLSNGVKNWRGMSDAGGRRIKRSVFIDVNSIKFCDQALLDRLKQIELIKDALARRENEMLSYNKQAGVDAALPINGKQFTNLGIFRLYLETYLLQHPKVHRKMTFIVRELQDAGQGLPLEIYMFSNDINWENYEALQSEVFDHIYAALPTFDLQAFQQLSGSDLRVTVVRDQ